MAYKVLVVEDEKEKARGIAYMIGKSNPECAPVLLAFDGEEGCKAAGKEHPDIILTDIRMPGMDGLEMISAIQKAGGSAVFVVLSGYAEFSYAKRAMGLGVKDFITKPVDEKELENTLNILCREIEKKRISRDSIDQMNEDMRDYAFREYLAGNPGSRPKVGEYLKQMGILESCSQYTCLVLEWEYSEAFEPPKGVICQEDLFAYAIRFSDTQLAAVICAKRLDRERKRSFVWDTFLRNAKRQEDFGIGVGSTYESYEGLPKAYEEALVAVNYQILRGRGTAILFEELCGMENQAELLTQKESENLKERIDRFDQEGFRIAVRGILRRVQEENRLSLPELQKLSLNIVLEGLHNIPTAQLQMNEYFGRNLFTLKSIEKFKTMEQLENWILNMVGSVNELMLQDNVPKKKDIVTEAKEYIRQNYNRNITLKDMAEKFYINPYYFSQLFKKKAGVTYQNYLTGYRIDRAKKLLEETDLHIYEICRLVGYSDVNHFNQLFERETGEKPSAYRQQLLSGGEMVQISSDTKIGGLLQGKTGDYIFPFFWQHGEPEEVLREYMKVIYDANLRSVCIESRPHPDFAGDGWWHDMDIILDEARRRGMRVWILDDSHFPTGYCNGAVRQKPAARRRWFLTYKILGELMGGEKGEWSRTEYEKAEPFEPSRIENYFHMTYETFPDDAWLGAVAVRKGGSSIQDLIPLEEKEGRIQFAPEKGEWKIYSCLLTRNRGPHRDYMNMLDEESCRTLIEAVYEPHYEHYRKDFGTTIAGFFSDEPEIGNGHLYQMDQKIYEVSDQPWSMALQEKLEQLWGDDYYRYLPLLWERAFDKTLTARVRYTYMDRVTRCVEYAFSRQMGDWCAEHGVQYIGHLIEDNNQHARCGSSLGHYFRGLAGQHMAGIDDIGGQVLPQGEDLALVSHLGTPRDAAFYHFTLGRLASSAAAIDIRKQGNSMCEIFGNYGWAEGVRLEAYLADHFMVRGVNHYVPHAFSAKAFPDPDCPPHFYAHGHNPQYRHFGVLMNYMNRVCTLISGGVHESEVAVLYHAEAEWIGGTCMYLQEPARILTEAQIGFDFIPSDVFTDDAYAVNLENGLQVNRQQYRCLVIPETDFITRETAEVLVRLGHQGFPCIFLNAYPKGICSWMESEEAGELLHAACEQAQVWPLDSLAQRLCEREIPILRMRPEEKMLRSYRYHADPELLYLVNEGTDVYAGIVCLKEAHTACCLYDAWTNRLEPVECCCEAEQTEIRVRIEPGKSWILLLDAGTGACKEKENIGVGSAKGTVPLNTGWRRLYCESTEYPAFGTGTMAKLPDYAEKELPDFGGFVRYERTLELAESTQQEWKNTVLEISDAGEAVQLFVNDADCGIQIVPPFRYDIGKLLKPGCNRLAIEVATTLERRVPPKRMPENWEPHNHIGLCGEVVLKW